MVTSDPFDHYCSSIQKLMEGGARLTTPKGHEGLTTDMKGRWTIGAFDTKRANKKETPKMKEVRLKRTIHNVDDHYTKDQQEVMKNFGFEWDGTDYPRGAWKKYEKGGRFQYKTGMFKGQAGYNDSYDAEVFLHTTDNHPVLFIQYYSGGWRDEDEDVVYHYKNFKELEQMIPKILRKFGGDSIKEVVGSNETGAHEIGQFYMRADDSLIKKFEDYMGQFEKLKERKFQDLAMNVIERFLKVQFKGPLATGLPIDE